MIFRSFSFVSSVTDVFLYQTLVKRVQVTVIRVDLKTSLYTLTYLSKVLVSFNIVRVVNYISSYTKKVI